jgi:hypothetical protein
MSAKSRRRPAVDSTAVRIGPSVADPHAIVYFRRHPDDDPAESIPARVQMAGWPVGVRAKVAAVLVAVATAPPSRFAGGGYWQAMHGAMSGWFEVRVDGPGREHFRVFCLLDLEGITPAGVSAGARLVIVDARRKAFRTTLSEADYERVRALGQEYLRRNPRSCA